MMMSLAPYREIAISNHTFATEDTREVLSTRFGEIVIDTRNALVFSKGLLGMPDRRRFALASLKGEKMQHFKLLQSLDDPKLSFIVLPVATDNAIIRKEDAYAASSSMGIHEEDLVILLIVCVHRTPGGTRLSVNARAPLLIDAARKTGSQHVFPQDYYQVQHYVA
ncbi:MAG: flagellar assembly protein FliW [Alphaproteobacteria bacterium]|nr:flagellar assembly protein FliW [Alphaproteobacteria bacterium]